MIAQGKRFEADGKQDIACENYVAVLKLAQALDHGMLLGKTIENALGMMAHDALHKNTGSKPAELIPQIESMVASAHRLSDCLEQEMEAALIAYGDIRTNPNPDQTDQFFIQHWTRIVKYIKERYEKNSARLKQPYPEFKEYVPDYNQLDKTMIAIMNMVDIGFPSLLNAHTRDSLKKSYAHATILKAALDAYKMQQGRYPAHLDELVPEILESPPTDPLANDSYRYDGSVLYSVGPDLVDNYATVIYESTNGIVSSGDIVFGQSRK